MRKETMFRVKEVEDRLFYTTKQEVWAQHTTLAARYNDLVSYNLEKAGAVLTQKNHVEIIADGKEKFFRLRRDLANATRFIHIQYYIIKDDEVFDAIVPILLERVKAGVEIRILYDGMGGRFMPERKWNRLRQFGIQVGCFFPPVLGRLHLRINYRNHRKVVIIDGVIGYVGGFNIGKEYLGLDFKFGYWRDTHLRIKGDATLSLQLRFALDWNYAVKENLFLDSSYFESVSSASVEAGRASASTEIQVITSGPDSQTPLIRDNYAALFQKANHHIYIQTPYFIPDNVILFQLQQAVKRGVDVRLMIPCKPDHPFVYWATYSYVGNLIEAGARCYTYEHGFLHAKGVMVDGEISCYGTANMDIRSFRLNFEINAVIYDEETTKALEALFWEDLKKCKEITRERYETRSVKVRMKEWGSRWLSPIL